ncbi:CHAT domain-containing protein, partial [Streptomyces sp. P17]|uniref:CHAT domain-containing protein n=1 Tax=Streptomyces sp. P17 TaxID=3074716 RepID=UPI0028F3E8B2
TDNNQRHGGHVSTAQNGSKFSRRRHRERLETAERGSAERGELLVALTVGLSFNFELDPRPELLDEAVAASSALAADSGDYHVHVAEYLIAVSEPFLRLFESCNDPVALEEAIRALRRAHGLLADLDRIRADVAQRLCVLLNAAVQFVGPTASADAIRFGREATELFPPGSYGQRIARTALSAALQDHANRTGNIRRLMEALSISRTLVEETQPGTDEHGRYRFDLALGLRIRAVLENDPRHFEEAIQIFRDLAEDQEVGDVRRAGRLIYLGLIHRDRYEATRDLAELGPAIAAFQRSARLLNASPLQRLISAQFGGELNASQARWDAAMAEYALAVEQVPFAIGLRLTREAQESLLPHTTGVALAAAACALELGDSFQAVRLLEAGRAPLIAQALDLRGILVDVVEQAPHLAAQWQQLREESSFPEREELVHRHRRALRWEGLRRRIRTLPGVGDLLAPLSHQALAKAAADGAVVVVNCHAVRTDAIIITGDDIDAIRLPITEEDARRAAGELLGTQPDIRSNSVAEQRFSEILEWLWDSVTEPVLHALGLDAPRPPAEAPRLWWCPTGVFTFLPLAAAGYNGSSDTVLDRIVSSFTPTVRALTHTRRPRPAQPGGFLGVAVPDVSGWPRLPGVADEIEFLRRCFPDGIFLTGADATAQQVVTQLANADWAHFACHAMSDPYSPSSSSLILHAGAVPEDFKSSETVVTL